MKQNKWRKWLARNIGSVVMLISYLLMGSLPSHMDALDSYYAGTGSLPVGIQDVHYVEGVVALAICLTAIRGVVRAFLGKDAVTETEKENLE